MNQSSPTLADQGHEHQNRGPMRAPTPAARGCADTGRPASPRRRPAGLPNRPSAAYRSPPAERAASPSEQPHPQIRQAPETWRIMGDQPLGIAQHHAQRPEHAQQSTGRRGGADQQASRHAPRRWPAAPRPVSPEASATAAPKQQPAPAPLRQSSSICSNAPHAAPRAAARRLPSRKSSRLRAEAIGNGGVAGQDHGPADGQALQAVHHVALGRRVQMGGRLVQQKQRRVLEEGARDGDTLRLATGQAIATLADRRYRAPGAAFR